MKTIQNFRTEHIQELEKKYSIAQDRWLKAGAECRRLRVKLLEESDPQEIIDTKICIEAVDAMRMQYANDVAALHDILETLNK